MLKNIRVRSCKYSTSQIKAINLSVDRLANSQGVVFSRARTICDIGKQLNYSGSIAIKRNKCKKTIIR